MASHSKLPRTNRHSLAEEFDGVTTRTEGELDDRHVVLYKLGYEPPEEEVQVDPQVTGGACKVCQRARTTEQRDVGPPTASRRRHESGHDTRHFRGLVIGRVPL